MGSVDTIRRYGGRDPMKAKLYALAAIAALLPLAACHQSSSPGSVDTKLASTRHEVAQKEVAALQRQARADATADADEASAVQRAEARKADSAYDVAVTEAEGRHKIDVARCAALAGEAQRECQGEADAALALSKADAEAARSASGG
jgi:hypothetical protein